MDVIESLRVGRRPLWRRRFAPAAARNAAILARFESVRERPGVARSHLFHGRYENLYVPLELIPELRPVYDFVAHSMAAILGRDDLRMGFWFNDMGPGQLTTRHTHDDDDEWLSAVYYVRAPANSGRLVLYDDDQRLAIEPEEGSLLLFPPDLPHEVEPNRSGARRLSIAFNAGADDPGEQTP